MALMGDEPKVLFSTAVQVMSSPLDDEPFPIILIAITTPNITTLNKTMTTGHLFLGTVVAVGRWNCDGDGETGTVVVVDRIIVCGGGFGGEADGLIAICDKPALFGVSDSEKALFTSHHGHDDEPL